MNSKLKNCNNLRALSGGLFFLLAIVSFNFACRNNEETPATKNAENRAENSTPERKVDYFQENLNSVQRAGFNFIYSFKRADGSIFTGDDKKFLKENAPAETNQWRLTEDEKAVVAGSNYKFTDEHLNALRARFTVEDYSVTKPEQNKDTVNANQNSIVNRNSNANQSSKVDK